MATLRINNNHYLASNARSAGYTDTSGDLHDMQTEAMEIIERFEGSTDNGQFPDGSYWYGDEYNPMVIVKVA